MAEDKDEEDDGLLPALDEVVDQILPEEPKFKNLKDDIWVELAEIYYKYEADRDQKRAFRKVMYEISDKIQLDKWDTVYHKLYRIEREKPSI